MGGLLHFVQRGGTWAGCSPAHCPSCCTKCNSPAITGQCCRALVTALPCYGALEIVVFDWLIDWLLPTSYYLMWHSNGSSCAPVVVFIAAPLKCYICDGSRCFSVTKRLAWCSDAKSSSHEHCCVFVHTCIYSINIETVSCPCNTCFWYARALAVRNTSRGLSRVTYFLQPALCTASQISNKCVYTSASPSHHPSFYLSLLTSAQTYPSGSVVHQWERETKLSVYWSHYSGMMW